MKYCPNCGVQCEDDQLFCAKCGTPLPVNVNIEVKTEEVNTEEVNTESAEETVAEIAEEVAAEEVVEETVAEAEPVEEPAAAPEVLDSVFAEEPASAPAPAPEGKLNVGMLVWSIINLALWFTPFAVVSLIMTILAKNSAPEASAKKIKFAVIFNILGTVCGFFNTLISIIAAIIKILENM